MEWMMASNGYFLHDIYSTLATKRETGREEAALLST